MNILSKITSYLQKEEKIDLEIFQKQTILFVKDFLSNSEFSKYEDLNKEIIYLIHYTLEVIKDDSLKGDKILKGNISKLDNYVFSKYRKEENLMGNIEQLIIVACSNRFEEDPHQNLFAYYVFMEEIGLEIISLFSDFYILTENQETFSQKLKNLSSDGYIIEKEIVKEDVKNFKKLQEETMISEALTNFYCPSQVNKYIKESSKDIAFDIDDENK